MIKAVILAGGRGERLKPLTDKIPKSLIRVGGIPLAEYSILLLKKFGIQDIIFSLGYLGDQIKKYFQSGKKLQVNINYIQENKPLGTAGAVGKLRNKINNTFLVMYGDIIRELNINKLLKFHQKNKGIGTICVYKNHHANPKSFVKFNKLNRITTFTERPGGKLPSQIWSNASCYIFAPEIFDFIPKNGQSDFGQDIFPEVLAAKRKLYAYKQTGYFLDVGNLEKLKKAEKYVAKHQV